LFNPATAGAGSHVITYTYSDGNSCTASATTTIVVNPLPTATIAYASPFCAIGTGAVTITGQTGGTFSSTAGLVINATTGEIDLAASIPGTYTVTYSFSDGNGCSNITTTSVTINALPNPVITGEDPVCVSDGTSTGTYTATAGGCNYNWVIPAGGTIVSGQGTNQIIVRWTTPGSMTITVTETACGTGCQGTGSLPVTVTPRPVTSPITHN
jgi:hypothetical protein